MRQGLSPRSARTVSPRVWAATPTPSMRRCWPWACCWPSMTVPRSCSNRCSGRWLTVLAPVPCCWVVCWRSPPLPRRSCSPATRRGLGWPGSVRVPRRPRSPRPPGCWSRGLPQIPGRAAGSAATAPGRAWAIPLGPVLGGVLIAVGGYPLLFTTLAVLGVVVAGWAVLVVPAAPPLPRTRQTVADLARRLTSPGFVRPTLALAAATGALSVGVGFLPVIGAERGLGPLITGAMVSLLAAAAALLQPRAGRAHDDGRIGDRTGMAGGLVVTALGCAAVLIPGVAGLLTAAVLIGVGVGL